MVIPFVSNLLVCGCNIIFQIFEVDRINIVRKLKVIAQYLFYEKVDVSIKCIRS